MKYGFFMTETICAYIFLRLTASHQPADSEFPSLFLESGKSSFVQPFSLDYQVFHVITEVAEGELGSREQVFKPANREKHTRCWRGQSVAQGRVFLQHEGKGLPWKSSKLQSSRKWQGDLLKFCCDLLEDSAQFSSWPLTA